MKETRDIPLHLIDSNRFQPRVHFEENALRELALSIQIGRASCRERV